MTNLKNLLPLALLLLATSSYGSGGDLKNNENNESPKKEVEQNDQKSLSDNSKLLEDNSNKLLEDNSNKLLEDNSNKLQQQNQSVESETTTIKVNTEKQLENQNHKKLTIQVGKRPFKKQDDLKKSTDTSEISKNIISDNQQLFIEPNQESIISYDYLEPKPERPKLGSSVPNQPNLQNLFGKVIKNQSKLKEFIQKVTEKQDSQDIFTKILAKEDFVSKFEKFKLEEVESLVSLSTSNPKLANTIIDKKFNTEEFTNLVKLGLTNPSLTSAIVDQPQKAGAEVTKGIASQAFAATNQTISILNARMASGVAGIASGSEEQDQNKLGLWAKATYNYGEGEKNSNAALKNISFNNIIGSIGFDAKLGTRSLAGLAYSFGGGKVNFDAQNTPNSSFKSNANMFSGYLSIGFTEKLHSNFILNFGEVKFTNHKDSTANLLNLVFKAADIKDRKVALNSIDIEKKVIYDLAVGNNFAMHPGLGMGYKKLSISDTKLYDRYRLLAGISFTSNFSSFENLVISPELHINGSMAVGNSKVEDKTTVTQTSSDLLKEADLREVLDLGNGFNIGFSNTLVYEENSEIQLGYDLSIDQKYTSHSGFMKLKLNF